MGLLRECWTVRIEIALSQLGEDYSDSSELSVGDRVLVGGLRVEAEVLDDERTSTPAVFKDLDNVPPYLLPPSVA